MVKVNKIMICICIVVCMMISPIGVFASTNNAGFEGGISKNDSGVKDEYDYKEVIFVTGKPVVLYGKVQMNEDQTSLTFKDLKSADGTIKASKKIGLTRVKNTDTPLQTIETIDLASFSETITVTDDNGQTTYTLSDYQFHSSVVKDNQPVIQFYQGMWNRCQKKYIINGNVADTVTVDIDGSLYGYDTYWSSTETQTIKQTLHYDQKSGETPTEWYGYGNIELSFNKNNQLSYFENAVHLSSFAGAYGLLKEEESVMTYSYNGGEPQSERLVNHPPQEMLYLPKYEDLRGHWAEESIKKLASLKIIEEDGSIFGPDLPETRADFARHMAIALRLDLEKSDEIRRSYVKDEIKKPFFIDVAEDDKDYPYIKAMNDNNVMHGKTDDMFFPNQTITREEAFTIVIRALGLERLAPTHNFNTRFKDDAKISKWAKKAVYVMDYLGIAQGYEGYINPKEVMTKAETAAMIDKLIEYMQKDLKEDYREGVLEY